VTNAHENKLRTPPRSPVVQSMKPGLAILPMLLTTACTTIYTSPAGEGSQHDPDPRPGYPDAGTPDDAGTPGYPGDAATPGDPSVHVVFATSTLYQGGFLGGLDGADAACAKQAKVGKLAGTFKAWLSDDTTAAADRLTHGTTPYVLVGGARLADDWADLTRADLQHEIDTDESGRLLPPPADLMIGAVVWTGSTFDGTRYPGDLGNQTCGGWRDAHEFGITGDRSQRDERWSLRTSVPCTFKAALYCIQQ
jgi:hypothetical protein